MAHTITVRKDNFAGGLHPAPLTRWWEGRHKT